jgi:hypothetical protein
LSHLFHVEWKRYTNYVKKRDGFYYDDEPKPGGYGFFDRRVIDHSDIYKDILELSRDSIVKIEACGHEIVDWSKVIERMMFSDAKGNGQLRYMKGKGCIYNGSRYPPAKGVVRTANAIQFISAQERIAMRNSS